MPCRCSDCRVGLESRHSVAAPCARRRVCRRRSLGRRICARRGLSASDSGVDRTARAVAARRLAARGAAHRIRVRRRPVRHGRILGLREPARLRHDAGAYRGGRDGIVLRHSRLVPRVRGLVHRATQGRARHAAGARIRGAVDSRRVAARLDIHRLSVARGRLQPERLAACRIRPAPGRIRRVFRDRRVRRAALPCAR